MEIRKKKKNVHLGIGHYGIGFRDGVNTVIARNVRALSALDPDMRITLFGKLASNYHEFIKPLPPNVDFRNIDEFNADEAADKLGGKSVFQQQVHDYIWMGTNLAEVLVGRLADMDVIMIENLGIGIQPYVTYAFYLFTQYAFTGAMDKRFIYRCHDFVQQRPANFKNVKKFHHPRFGVVPDWHSILYPAYPSITYIAINRYDRMRLLEHGIEEENIFYIPNPVDRSIVPQDDRRDELREKIIAGENLDPATRFLLYPVRCIRRKNVEEAVFLTAFFNRLVDGNVTRNNCRLKERYHLLVSIRPESGDDAEYADQLAGFVEQHKLPVTIGLGDLVALEREQDPADDSKIRSYSIGDLYRASDLVITTSVLEGFGFSYIEPWLLDRAVIGRSIPYIAPDFQAAGMKLGHLYNALIVDGRDYKDIGGGTADLAAGLEERLQKVLRLDNPAYINSFIDRNETSVIATLRLFDRERREALVRINREVVERVYSQERIGEQLYRVVKRQ
jgi:glycosyltransferase involved in cell wall biosynthesis